jgi:hypothetical protein
MPFEYDIFISHARLSNQDNQSGFNDWVRQFRKVLGFHLGKLLGREARIWMDGEPALGDSSRDAAFKKLRNSKVFVCVLSPAYVRSDRCMEELRQFVDAAPETGGLVVENKSRVFPIVKTYLSDEQRPQELKDLRVWAFYVMEGDNFPREFSSNTRGFGFFKFVKTIDYLASEIKDLLEQLVDKAPAKSPEPQAAGGQFTFICYAREDQSFVIELASELKARGVRVWVDQLDIRGGENWDQKIDEALYGCSQFLIVLSPAAVGSTEVRGELRTALDEHKRIVPVVYQTCRVPRQLRSIQHIDFSSTDIKNEERLQQLLRALPERIL